MEHARFSQRGAREFWNHEYDPLGGGAASPLSTAIFMASQSMRSWCPRQNSMQLLCHPRSNLLKNLVPSSEWKCSYR